MPTPHHPWQRSQVKTCESEASYSYEYKDVRSVRKSSGSRRLCQAGEPECKPVWLQVASSGRASAAGSESASASAMSCSSTLLCCFWTSPHRVSCSPLKPPTCLVNISQGRSCFEAVPWSYRCELQVISDDLGLHCHDKPTLYCTAGIAVRATEVFGCLIGSQEGDEHTD